MSNLSDVVFRQLDPEAKLIHEDSKGVLPAGRIGARGEAGEPAASESVVSILAYDPATDDVPQWHTAAELDLGGGGSGNATLIQGEPVDATAPSAGDVLIYDGDSYAPGKLRASDLATVLTPIFTEDGHVVFDPDLGLIYVEVELV